MRVAAVVLLALALSAAPAHAAWRTSEVVSIGGAQPGEQLGYAVAAGDVNGDGIDDVVMGAPDTQPPGRKGAGAAYVVFGHRGGVRADVGQLGASGFRVDGPAPDPFFDICTDPRAGSSVGAAGDVNGDGRDDLLVGAPFRGAAYVVFGKADSEPVDVDRLGSGGYRIQRDCRYDFFLASAITPAGDFNGDGLDDLLVTEDETGDESISTAGVLFGKATTETVDPDRAPGVGFGSGGPSFGPAGDVNGDGLDDVIIGVPEMMRRLDLGGIPEGGALVAFGTRHPRQAFADPRSKRFRGLILQGARHGDAAGTAVAGGEDVNGDGRPDVVIGAPGADPGRRKDAGSVYVVFGRSRSGRIDFRRLGGAGYRLDGRRMGHHTGSGLALLPDLTADRRADIAIDSGLPNVYAGQVGQLGPLYVVRGETGTGARTIVGSDRVAGTRRTGVGWPAMATGDVDGNGRSDLLFGASREAGGLVSGLSLRPTRR